MNIEKEMDIIKDFCNIKILYGRELCLLEEQLISYQSAIKTILTAYEKEKEKNKNKDKILRNIRDEFLKYDWKNANPIQTYNQVKSLYESIYCKPYEE